MCWHIVYQQKSQLFVTHGELLAHQREIGCASQFEELCKCRQKDKPCAFHDELDEGWGTFSIKSCGLTFHIRWITWATALWTGFDYGVMERQMSWM